MAELHFEWDPRKAAANAAKHGVTFDEAKTVFYDETAFLIDDLDYSKSEERFILMGSSAPVRGCSLRFTVTAGKALRSGSYPPAGRVPQNENPTRRTNHEEILRLQPRAS